MQIDMHYYGVYALARMAGLNAAASKTIATASQYVDDAVKGNFQNHENGNKLAPIVTAHKAIELIENRDTRDQPFVWLPFHFFPGNEGNEFTERLLCVKNSALMQKTLDHYLTLSDRCYALELIGLAAHVYADTFSHFGFSGVSSRKNRVKANTVTPLNADDPTKTYLEKKLSGFFRKFGFQGGLWQNIKRWIIHDGAEVASGALGHGAVATFPDLPYLEWQFTFEANRTNGRLEHRNNTERFLEASECLHAFFRRFALARPEHSDGTGGVNFVTYRGQIEAIFSLQRGKTARSERWRGDFNQGRLGVGAGGQIPIYSADDWCKQWENFGALAHPEEAAEWSVYRFHQAADYHLHYVLRELLPGIGLVVV